MTDQVREFRLEEYKQIRAEVVDQLQKIDQYYRFAILVPTGVYSWLLAQAFGIHKLKNADTASGMPEAA